MAVVKIDPRENSAATLVSCTAGATMLGYVTVLGLVALVGAVAFAQFDDAIRSGVRAEMQTTAKASGEQTDGPVGSLAAEVTGAGAEALAVQGSWALAQKAGARGAAAARRSARGRGAVGFKDERRRGSEHGDPGSNGNDSPPRGGPDQKGGDSGSCRNGVCGPGKGNKCFVAGTLVATPGGWLSIEEIAPGDWVLSRDELSASVVSELLAEADVGAPHFTSPSETWARNACVVATGPAKGS